MTQQSPISIEDAILEEAGFESPEDLTALPGQIQKLDWAGGQEWRIGGDEALVVEVARELRALSEIDETGLGADRVSRETDQAPAETST